MFNEIQKNVLEILGVQVQAGQEYSKEVGMTVMPIYQTVILYALETLVKEDKDEFEALLSGNPTPDTIFEFLSTKIPDIDEVVYEEAEKMKQASTNQ